MTISSAAAAFVSSPVPATCSVMLKSPSIPSVSFRHSLPAPFVLSRSVSSTTTASIGSSSLTMAASPQLIHCSETAIKFFTDIRTPAALIAGSALGAFFIMVNRVKDKEQRKSKIRFSVIFIYHVLSLLALCLSLNTIVVATAASNSLLVGEYNPLAVSVYEFLKREFLYEYILIKWCFSISIICFLQAVACRALIEFDFLRKDRIHSSIFVLLSFTGLIAHCLHMLNDGLYSFPNLWSMTIGLGKVRC